MFLKVIWIPLHLQHLSNLTIVTLHSKIQTYSRLAYHLPRPSIKSANR